MSSSTSAPPPPTTTPTPNPSAPAKKKKKKNADSRKKKYAYPSQIPSSKDLTDMFRAHKEGRRKGSTMGGVSMCWLCDDRVATTMYQQPAITAGKGGSSTAGTSPSMGLCTRCAAGVLRHVVLPSLESSCIFKDHEGKMCAAVARVEGDEKAGRVFIPPVNGASSSSVASPSSGAVDIVDGAPWHCVSCAHPDIPAGVPRCPKCAFLKPDPPLCSLCFRDYTHQRLCGYTKQLHDTWKCNSCHRVNGGDIVECRVCRLEKTWYCSKCSMENPISLSECSACDLASTRLSSLGSFMRREVIKEMGLDVKEQYQERTDSLIVEENKLRLDTRVEQLGMTHVAIGDDGNCLFRAISHQLLRTDVWHLAIRLLTTDYLRVHFSDFIAYFVTPEEISEMEAARNALLTKRREVEEQMKTMTAEEKAMVVLPDEVRNEGAARRLAEQALIPDKPNKGFNDFVSALERDKEWGDEITVSAACRAVSANVHVLTSDIKKWHLTYRCFSSRHLVLTYARPVHFGSITLQSRDVLPPVVDVSAKLREMQVRHDRDVLDEEERRRVLEAEEAAAAGEDGGDGKKKKKKKKKSDNEDYYDDDADVDGPFVGPMPQPLPERGVTTNVNIRIARTPMYRMTTHDFERFEYEAVVVKVHLGDSSTTIGISDRREVVGSRYGHYFYIHFLRHEDVTASDTGRWTKVQRTVQWSKPFPLFVLQRSDTGAFLTPSSDVDDVTFGSLQRPTKRSAVMTNGLQGDISNALMTCTVSENAGTMFQARFVCEEIECREFQYNDDRIFTSTENRNKSTVMFLMPFRKAVMRYCLRCKMWYDEENPTKPGFGFGTSPSDKEEAKASLATLYKNADQQMKKKSQEEQSFSAKRGSSLKYGDLSAGGGGSSDGDNLPSAQCQHINHADILDLD